MICVIFSFSDVLLVLIFLSTHHAGELAFYRKEHFLFTTAYFEILDKILRPALCHYNITSKLYYNNYTVRR